jgi:hypothetical protein
MSGEYLRHEDECGSCETVPASHDNIFINHLQNRDRLASVSSAASYSSQEIVMASSRKRMGFSIAATSAAISLVSAGAAFASQGPGGGLGSASSFTQLTMAVIVWGTSALVVGAGLIGAVRQR